MWDITEIVDGKSHLTIEISPPKDFNGHQNCVQRVASLPDGQKLVSCWNDSDILIWDLANSDQNEIEVPDKKLVCDKKQHSVRAVVFVPGGDYLIASIASSFPEDTEVWSIEIWNWHTQTCLRELSNFLNKNFEPELCFTPMQIDPNCSSLFLTETGAWNIPEELMPENNLEESAAPSWPPPCRPCHPYRFVHGTSITYRNDCVIDLPEAYRPSTVFQCGIRGFSVAPQLEPILVTWFYSSFQTKPNS